MGVAAAMTSVALETPTDSGLQTGLGALRIFVASQRNVYDVAGLSAVLAYSMSLYVAISAC